MRVAFLRHVGPYEDVKQTWINLVARLSVDKQIGKRSTFIGIGHDNPSITPAADLRYDACITVAQNYKPKKPIDVQIIDGGDYAVTKNCPVPKIKDAFQFLYSKWLTGSSRELRPLPAFLELVDAQTSIAVKKQKVNIYC